MNVIVGLFVMFSQPTQTHHVFGSKEILLIEHDLLLIFNDPNFSINKQCVITFYIILYYI